MTNVSNSFSLNNLNPATTTMFTANVGSVLRLCRPAGYPPWPIDNKPESTETLNLEYEAMGFKLLEPIYGKFIRLEELTDDDTCVYYQHEKSGRQIISYYANGAIVPIVFYAVVQGITVHDHASIYMGGPAFATYYAETPQEE